MRRFDRTTKSLWEANAEEKVEKSNTECMEWCSIHRPPSTKTVHHAIDSIPALCNHDTDQTRSTIPRLVGVLKTSI